MNQIYEITERDGTLFIKQHKQPLEQIIPTGDYIVRGNLKRASHSGVLHFEGKRYDVIKDGGWSRWTWDGPAKIVLGDDYKNKYYVNSSDYERTKGCIIDQPDKNICVFHEIPKSNWWHRYFCYEYLNKEAIDIFYIKRRKYICRESGDVKLSTSVYVLER